MLFTIFAIVDCNETLRYPMKTKYRIGIPIPTGRVQYVGVRYSATDTISFQHHIGTENTFPIGKLNVQIANTDEIGCHT